MADKTPAVKSLPQGAYTILPTRESVVVGDDQRLKDVVIVPYKTAVGDTGTVQMDKADYTAADAVELVEEAVREHLMLHGVLK